MFFPQYINALAPLTYSEGTALPTPPAQLGTVSGDRRVSLPQQGLRRLLKLRPHRLLERLGAKALLACGDVTACV